MRQSGIEVESVTKLQEIIIKDLNLRGQTLLF